MESLGLLIGHLVGDYIFQNDWQAKHKVALFRFAKPNASRPVFLIVADAPKCDDCTLSQWIDYDNSVHAEWVGHIACTVHCLLYTLAVWLCSCWWMPLWGLVVCFIAHWPIDRFRLARVWMVNVSRQEAFATGPLAPWSVVVVDNTFHLLTLFIIGMIQFHIIPLL